MVKLTTAYFLWFTLGLTGAHHIYLKRDYHAFVWFCTLGGFVVGWIGDFRRLPSYVKESAEDEDGYISDDNHDQNYSHLYDHNSCDGRHRKPDFSLVRLGGMAAVGYLFGYLVLFAYPPFFTAPHVEDSYVGAVVTCVQLALLSSAVAFGVYIVGNMGPRLRASFFWCYVGSVVGGVSQIRLQFLSSLFGPNVASKLTGDEGFSLGVSSLFAASVVSCLGLSWRLPRRRTYRSPYKRLRTLAAFGTVYILLWGCTLHFHDTITHQEANERALLRKLFFDLKDSPMWSRSKTYVSKLWDSLKIKVFSWRRYYWSASVNEGRSSSSSFQRWWEYFEMKLSGEDDFVEPPFDAQETDPYKILGLNQRASQTQIRNSYMKMVKIWHPDKQATERSRQRAHGIFIKIQHAYEKLRSSSRTRYR